MRDVKISVAVATYRGRQFLREQLLSIARQTEPVDEVVVSDDCSPDGTADLAEAVLREFSIPGHVLRGCRNRGVTANFEVAIRACRGQIIFLSDQDDIWRPWKVARIIEELTSKPDLEAVFTDATVVDECRRQVHHSLLALSHLTSSERRQISRGNSLTTLMRRNVATGATMAVRAASVTNLFPVPPSWYHDEWIAINLSTHNRLGMIAEPLIEYRQHGNNTIGAPRPATLLDKLSSLARPSRAERERMARRAEELANYSRLSQDNEKGVRDAVLEKGRHLRIRANLPNERWRRLPTIVSELFNARYFQYSQGMRAALRDALQAMD